jgi:hypothetical protein
MSKLDDKIALYTKSANDLELGLDDAFIAAVTKGLGPSIYNKDAESVSCSDSSELDTVKKNFLIKKLGLEDSNELDDAIKEVCQKMGTSNRNKYRALFYALLAKKFSKEDIYA